MDIPRPQKFWSSVAITLNWKIRPRRLVDKSCKIKNRSKLLSLNLGKKHSVEPLWEILRKIIIMLRQVFALQNIVSGAMRGISLDCSQKSAFLVIESFARERIEIIKNSGGVDLSGRNLKKLSCLLELLGHRTFWL